jgi:hypothetical protein
VQPLRGIRVFRVFAIRPQQKVCGGITKRLYLESEFMGSTADNEFSRLRFSPCRCVPVAFGGDQVGAPGVLAAVQPKAVVPNPVTVSDGHRWNS